MEKKKDEDDVSEDSDDTWDEFNDPEDDDYGE